MWIEAILVIIIVCLVLWIYYSGGGTPRTRRYTQRIKELKQKNQDLRETNKALREGLSSSSDRFTRPTMRVSELIEDLVRVREAVLGSKSAKETLNDKFEEEISPDLVREVLSSAENISAPLRRRLANEVFLGDIGKDILKDLREGKSVADASVDAGVPLRVGKERVRLLKETGYLDRKLDLTQRGSEVLEW